MLNVQDFPIINENFTSLQDVITEKYVLREVYLSFYSHYQSFFLQRNRYYFLFFDYVLQSNFTPIIIVCFYIFYKYEIILLAHFSKKV